MNPKEILLRLLGREKTKVEKEKTKTIEEEVTGGTLHKVEDPWLIAKGFIVYYETPTEIESNEVEEVFSSKTRYYLGDPIFRQEPKDTPNYSFCSLRKYAILRKENIVTNESGLNIKVGPADLQPGHSATFLNECHSGITAELFSFPNISNGESIIGLKIVCKTTPKIKSKK